MNPALETLPAVSSRTRIAALPKRQQISDQRAFAVQNFDSLPDSARVDTNTVMAILVASRMTIHRMVKRRQLPAPRKLLGAPNSRNTWAVGEIRAVLDGTWTPDD